MKLEILLFVFIPLFCKAQNQYPIQTDRPDQTECPFIVPTNYFQFENGFSYEKTNIDLSEIVVPTILMKFGINNHFELRFISEYVVNNNIDINNSGINPILIGFKTRLFEEKGLIPLTSFIGHISIPKAASIAYKKQFAAPEFRFTMQHTIAESQTISYNIGAEWNGETAEPTYIYTLTSGYSMSDKTSVYVEFYGFIPNDEQSNHRFDGGFCYLLNSNHQFDISAGFGLTQTAPNYFFALGYSFRFII